MRFKTDRAWLRAMKNWGQDGGWNQRTTRMEAAIFRRNERKPSDDEGDIGRPCCGHTPSNGICKTCAGVHDPVISETSEKGQP